MTTIDDLSGLTGAELLSAGRRDFTGVTTNSLDVRPGDVFVALQGARDGHDFLDDAVRAGAGALIVERSYTPEKSDVTVVRVPDTLRALQELGSNTRAASDADVIAITGSVGKTTTKDLITHLLGSREVLSSPKSYNNHLGVPLTLLQLTPATTNLVAEVGTNHPGEIQRLVDLVRPRIGLVTNVGHAHLGNFGSSEALAAEKASLLTGVIPGGVWLVNADDEVLGRAVADLDRPADTSVVTFGFHESADIRVTDVEVDESGTSGHLVVAGERRRFTLPLVGRHFASTAASAVAAVLQQGVPLDDAVTRLATFPGSEGRAKISEIRGGTVHLIDDSYNGSPDSMLAALDTLATFPVSRRVAVVGEMRELGEWSDSLHTTVGHKVAESATDMIFIGPSYPVVRDAAIAAGMAAERISAAPSAPVAADLLETLLDTDPDLPSAVLVKGARFVHTERIALALGGVHVGCQLELCDLYIHCRNCPMLGG